MFRDGLEVMLLMHILYVKLYKNECKVNSIYRVNVAIQLKPWNWVRGVVFLKIVRKKWSYS